MSRQRPAPPVTALARRLGGASAAGIAQLDQPTMELLVELMDRESDRRAEELQREIASLLNESPWPIRRTLEKALSR